MARPDPREEGFGAADAEPPEEAWLPAPDREPDDEPTSLRESAVLFARDVAVAFLVVAILLGVMFAYTQVWPPMVVVESDSMQHSDSESFIGVIDTGDLVLVQAVNKPEDVVPYVQGRATGHATYSDFGDVIIFQRPGAGPGTTPIIHRAMAYVLPNASGGADVPELVLLDPSLWQAERNGTPWPSPFGITAFTLFEVGYRGSSVRFDLSGVQAPGFLTKGDHNANPDPWSNVGVGRILGKARGELPWFGLIKLTLLPGTSGCCPQGWGYTGPNGAPKNSWDSLLVALIVLIVAPFAADFGWAAWKERRAGAKGAPGRWSRVFPRRLSVGGRLLFAGIGLGAFAASFGAFVLALAPGGAGGLGLVVSAALAVVGSYSLVGGLRGGFGSKEKEEVGTAPEGEPLPPPTDGSQTGSVGPEGDTLERP